jgi:hypothetical protein
VIYINPLGAVYGSGMALTLVCIHVSHGANVNGLIVSSVSILMFFSVSAT